MSKVVTKSQPITRMIIQTYSFHQYNVNIKEMITQWKYLVATGNPKRLVVSIRSIIRLSDLIIKRYSLSHIHKWKEGLNFPGSRKPQKKPIRNKLLSRNSSIWIKKIRNLFEGSRQLKDKFCCLRWYWDVILILRLMYVARLAKIFYLQTWKTWIWIKWY